MGEDGHYTTSGSSVLETGYSAGLDRFTDSLLLDYRNFGELSHHSNYDSESSSEASGDASDLSGGDHPIFIPSKTKCMWCKQRGHTLVFCHERLTYCEQMRKRFCQRGYHMPHLHDDADLFRCQWCGTHLDASYVRRNYPNTYHTERVKCEAVSERLRIKYGN